MYVTTNMCGVGAEFVTSSTNNFNNNRTLCDWVQNFRLKKIQMKRYIRGRDNLRVSAILTTALNSAEKELRRKQQERFQKWTEIQSKFEYNNYINNNNSSNNNNCRFNENFITNDGISITSNSYYFKNETEDELKRQQEISDLWKSELSDLDQFMKNIGKVKA